MRCSLPFPADDHHTETRKTYRAVLSEPTLIIPVPEAQASTSTSGVLVKSQTDGVKETSEIAMDVELESQSKETEAASSLSVDHEPQEPPVLGSGPNTFTVTHAAKNKRPREPASPTPGSVPPAPQSLKTLDERQKRKKKKRRHEETASGSASVAK